MKVVDAGPRLLVQDLGRPGLASLGVSPSGAVDPLLLRRANALAGNRRAAACLEVLITATFEATAPSTVVVTGGEGSETVWLETGDRLRVRARDLVAYVAGPGGVAARAVLGSRSRDTLAGLGPETPPVITAGDDQGPGERPPPVVPPLTTRIRLLPSPWAAPDVTGRWTVSQDSSRVAVRLDGPRVGDGRSVEPEGIVRGAVQLPPSGRPVVFVADHPVTGGYPVAGVVHPDDLRSLVQARPGTRVVLERMEP